MNLLENSLVEFVNRGVVDKSVAMNMQLDQVYLTSY